MAKSGTREPQYNVMLEYRDKHGQEPLGLMINQAWHDDPRRLAFTFSRYKFVSKMLEGCESVLEVGCGNGFLTLPLSRRGPVVAADFSREMLARNPATEKLAVRAESLPFPDGAFPVVFCQGLLHHCPHPAAVLREMARVSSRYVIAHEPNRDHPAMAAFSLCKRVEWGALKFSRRYLESLFRGPGLSITESRARGLILPNRTPAALAGLAERWDTPAAGRLFGFYTLVVGEKT